MHTAVPRATPARFRRWFGPSALIALGIFVAGRIALEPLRNLPQYDAKGMDPYSAVENFQ
jgi:hypothetical protein